jgi:hypothetical protein
LPGYFRSQQPKMTAERLLNPDREPQNWLMNHRTYDGQRFSPLSRINKDNIKNLHLAYACFSGRLAKPMPCACSRDAATTGLPAVLGFVATAMQLCAISLTRDGEAVVCGPDGIAIFDAPHRHGTVSEAMLYALDLLELDGDHRKRLSKPIGKRRRGIILGEPTNEDGATIFRHACNSDSKASFRSG